MKMIKKDVDDKESDVFELTDSEYILNLEFYLHRSILKWQDALEAAIRQGNDIETGLTNRGLAGDMVEGIAKAKGIIHWEELPIPDKKDKHRDTVVKNNEEAKEFKGCYEQFKKEIDKLEISQNVKNVKLSDFKVFEVLKTISKNSTKRGNVIV